MITLRHFCVLLLQLQLLLLLVLVHQPNGVWSWTIQPKRLWNQLRRQVLHPTILKFDSNILKNDTQTVDEYFMGLALQQAKKAERKGEVPIGAIVVMKKSSTEIVNDTSPIPTTFYEVLSKGYNRVEQYHDASAHAEMMALQQAGSYIGNWRLGSSGSSNNGSVDNNKHENYAKQETILYSTLEPCPMCLAACQAFRINTIVYGAADLRLGAVQTHMNLLDVAPHPFHNITNITSGVLQEESSDLLRTFFRQRRQESKRQTQAQKARKQQVILENKQKKQQRRTQDNINNNKKKNSKTEKKTNKNQQKSKKNNDFRKQPSTTKKSTEDETTKRKRIRRKMKRIVCFWRRNDTN